MNKGHKTFFTVVVVSLFFLSSLGFSQSEDILAKLEAKKMSVVSFTVKDKDKTEIAKGTAFIIGKEVCVTNYHLVSSSHNVEGLNFEGKKAKFDGIYSVDKKSNLALLKIKRKDPAISLGTSENLKTDINVFAIGASESGEIRVYNGKIKSVHSYEPLIRIIETDITAPSSFSGAPVVDSEGNVIGIMTFVDTRRNFVVPVEHIKNLAQSPKATKFKDWENEDYFDTYDGAYSIGKILAKIGLTGPAEKYIKKVLAAKPDNIDAQRILAEIYVEQRNYSSAASEYKKLSQVEPNNDAYMMKLGYIYNNMRKWKEAISAYEKAVALNTQNSASLYFIGNAYMELREFGNAVGAYEKFLETKPIDVQDTYLNMGICYSETEQHDKAASAYQEALKSDPENMRLMRSLAQAYQKSQQYDMAADVFYRLAELSPKESNLLYNTIINMYDQAKLHEKAIEAAKKVVSLRPDDPDALFNLGTMFSRLNNDQEAANAFKKVIEIDPANEYALRNLSSVYTKLKQYRNSNKILEKFIQIKPDNVDVWLQIGVNYMQMKQYYKALAPLQKTIELNPGYGLAYYNLGLCYLSMQDNTRARSVYLKLKDIDASLAQRLLRYFR